MPHLQELILQHLLSLPDLAVNFFIFLFAYIESMPIVTIFFPGMMVAVIIGTFTQTGVISPFIAINLIALGSFLGDVTSLYLGPQLLKITWFKKFIEKEDYQKHWAVFDKHIAWIIILSKTIPSVRSTPSLFAGARGISKKKYFFYTLISSYLWSAVAVFGGNALGHIFGSFTIPIILIGFTLAGVVGYFWTKRKT